MRRSKVGSPLRSNAQEVSAQGLPQVMADLLPFRGQPINVITGVVASPGGGITSQTYLRKILEPSPQKTAGNGRLWEMRHGLPSLPPLGFKTKSTSHRRKDVAIRRRTEGVETMRSPKKGRNDLPVYGQNGVDLSFSPCFAC